MRVVQLGFSSLFCVLGIHFVVMDVALAGFMLIAWDIVSGYPTGFAFSEFDFGILTCVFRFSFVCVYACVLLFHF